MRAAFSVTLTFGLVMSFYASSACSQSSECRTEGKKLTVINQDQLRRSFQMIIGLHEGYHEGKTYSIEDGQRVITTWLIAQKNAGKPYLPGQLIQGTMLYVHEGPHTEPVLTYMGEVSPLYNSTLTDEKVIEALSELAGRLAEEFKQVRIYLMYQDQIFILENQS
jgi:hypothetical protein